MNLPLHISTPHTDDLDQIRALTPGALGGPPNTYATLRAAAGVCADVRRHIRVPGAAVISDFRGRVIPDELWLPDLMQVRGREQRG